MTAPSRRALGASGEHAAAEWLEVRGYTVLARNVRTRSGEIDLVARQGSVVAFVEVKSRRTSRFGHPVEAIVTRKQRRLVRQATLYLHRCGLDHCTARFDAIAVHLDSDGRPVAIEHVPDAFQAGE
ncbi:MAG: YraN family protein [Armatimonadota bacterium]